MTGGPLEELADDARALLAGPDDAVMTLATSGSAGRPRTVRRTVGSWRAGLGHLDALTGVGREPDEVIWAPGPATSTLTRYAVWQAVAAGARPMITGLWRGVPDGAEQATLVHAVPVVLDAVLDAAHRAAGGAAGGRWRLRCAVVAGGVLPAGLRERADRLGVRLVEYYGAAELSFVAVDTDGRGLVPFPGVEVDLRDGVLWARSPYLAQSVDGVPVADAQGWASAGDRAVVTARGGLRILGRGGAATVGGSTVHLADVESALSAVPGVREVVCTAVPDPVLGQRLAAVVVPSGAGDPVPALRRAGAALEPPARPARHLVVADLPRTPGGKIDRAALPGLFAVTPARAPAR